MTLLLMITCILAWGLAQFLMKLASQGGLSPATSILFTIFGYLAMVPFVLHKADFHLTPRYLLPVLVGICYVVGNLTFYKLCETQDVTLLAPITALNIAVPILLGWLVLREPMTFQRVAGILLAGVALWLLMAPEKAR
ncbi:MAG: EamA family transporter [Verrucomicrobiia bacterium]|jgi:drug/metabolite transporter (DMT)-like permease